MSFFIKNHRTYGILVIISSIIGFLASFELTLGKIEKLSNKDAILSCDVSPFASCGTVMENWQSELFGFPNQLLGIVCYSIALFFGILILSQVTMPRWMYIAFNMGTLLGAIFITWLFTQSVWSIGVLCLWCIVVWSIHIPLFVYTTFYCIKSKFYGTRIINDYILKIPSLIVILWYVIIAACIAFVFRTEFNLWFATW